MFDPEPDEFREAEIDKEIKAETAGRMRAYRATCSICGKAVLEVVFPSGAVIICDAGKKRHIAVGGCWDSCCIWGYTVHDCPQAPKAVGPLNLEETPVERL